MQAKKQGKLEDEKESSLTAINALHDTKLSTLRKLTTQGPFVCTM